MVSSTCTPTHSMQIHRGVRHSTAPRWHSSPQTIMTEMITPRAIIQVIEKLAPPAVITREPRPLLVASEVLSMADTLSCPICLEILNQPIELPCRVYVCCTCLVQHIKTSLCLKCPCCYTTSDLQPEDLKSAPDLVVKLLSDIAVQCPSCKKDVIARNYNTHKCSPQINTQSMIAAEVITQLFESTSSNTIQLQTGGTVTHYLNMSSYAGDRAKHTIF